MAGEAHTGGQLLGHRGAWRALILALACLGWGLGIAGLPLAVAQHKLSLSSSGDVAVALTCAAAGTIVAWHQRSHPMVRSMLQTLATPVTALARLLRRPRTAS